LAGDVFWRCSLLDADLLAFYEGIALDRYAMNNMIVLLTTDMGLVKVGTRKQAQVQGMG